MSPGWARGRGARLALAATLAGAFPTPLGGQEPRPTPDVPAFPSQAAAITVDVVVLDGAGQPVRGLTRADFEVREDGRPQTLVGFEARELLAHAEEAATLEASPAAAAGGAPAALSTAPAFAVLIDDLGLTPLAAIETRKAIAGWLRARAHPSVEIALLTSSGDVWWADQVGRGREDLLAVLERVHGKRALPLSSDRGLTLAEAYQITTREGGGGVETGLSTLDLNPNAGPAGGEPPRLTRSLTVLERVADRWYRAETCHFCRNCRDPLAHCKSQAKAMALDVYYSWTRRAEVVLAALARLSQELAAVPGRKSILLVSEDLLRDETVESRMRAAIDAAQRANTSLYFSGALGLKTTGSGSAESRIDALPGDLGRMSVEETLIAMGGAEQLADATGGVAVTASNDLAAGLERMADDASAYYVLGYQPERAPDGKWRKLEVRVARPGVTVRARRGYLAAPPLPIETPRVAAGKDDGKGRRDKPAALQPGTARDGIPLQMSAYVQGPDQAGSARVLVALEIDGRRVRAEPGTAGAKASLDVSLVGIVRDQGKALPLEQVVDLTLSERDAGGWWALFRELHLPPGVSQVRAFVRDRATGLGGLATQRVEVPAVDQPYLGTPLLTDRTQPPLAPGEPPRLVPAASRVFRLRGPLFCQYELFGFAGHKLPGVARVSGGYTLRTPGGRVIVVPPTPIASDGERVVRRLALDARQLEPGDYELVLTVEDHLAQRTFLARDSFTVVGEDGPPAR